MEILVTGGTGGLGRALVPQLSAAGHTVRVMSRSAGAGRVAADLSTGTGLAEAVTGAEAIVHSATDPRNVERVDVEGTRRLLEAARAAQVKHFVYVSIVGIEQVPLRYYRAKVACERLVLDSGLGYTIGRVTQFHSFIEGMLKRYLRFPIALLPTGFVFQPIDTAAAALRFCELVAAGPSGRAADLGGPEVLTFGALAKAWLAARQSRRWVVPLRLGGRAFTAMRRGALTCPDHCSPSLTWEQWLRTPRGAGDGVS